LAAQGIWTARQTRAIRQLFRLQPEISFAKKMTVDFRRILPVIHGLII
jgi:hypothetical protein